MKPDAKRVAIATTAIGIAFLLLYSNCAPLTIGWKDAGEFTLFSTTLGIAHPAGYPVLLLAGKVFSLLPFGTIAFRLNFLSAFFGAASLCLFYVLLLRLARLENSIAPPVPQSPAHAPVPPFISILAFVLTISVGLSRTIWRSAISCEAYTLHLFFILAMFFILYSDWRANPKIQYLGCFLVGLGAANHVTFLVYSPILLVPIFAHRLRTRAHRLRSLALCALFLLLGLSSYLYLPVRASHGAVFNWGNPDNLGRFFAHVTGRQYEFKTLSIPLSLFPFRTTKFLSEIVQELDVPILLLALAGLPFFPWRRVRIWCPWLALLLLNALFFIKYGEWVPHLFLPSYLALWILAAVSIFSLAAKVIPAKRSPSHRVVSSNLIRVVLAAALVLAIFMQFSRNAYLIAQSRNSLPFTLARRILSSLPPGSLVILEDGNSVNETLYAQRCERLRDDVTILDPFGSYYSQALHKGLDELRSAWRGAQPYPPGDHQSAPDFRTALLQFLRPENGIYDQSNADRAIFADAAFVLSSEISPDEIVSPRMISRIIPPSAARPIDPPKAGSIAHQETDYLRNLIAEDRVLVREPQTREALLAHLNNLALLFYRVGLRPEATREWDAILRMDPSHRDALLNRAVAYDEAGATPSALALLTRARTLYPDDPLVRYQIAIFYIRHNQPHRALDEFRACSQLDPRDTAALYNYAVLLAREGDNGRASAALRRLLRLNPADPRAQKLLNTLSP